MSSHKKNLVWIASYPKSGNTWFRIFIQNLIFPSCEPVDINNLKSSRIATNRNIFDEYLCIESSDLTFEEIDKLRPIAYGEYSLAYEKLAFIKVHDRWGLNSEGKPIFPSNLTKGVIYLVRNPLDVAVSLSYHNNINLNSAVLALNDTKRSYCSTPTKLASQLRHHISNWSDHVQSWTNESNLPLYHLRYEDMLANPSESFAKVVAFLELDYNKTQIDLAVNRSDFRILQAQEKEFGFKEKPMHAKSFFRAGSTGNWEPHLSVKHKEEIIKHHRPMMEKYGYLSK